MSPFTPPEKPTSASRLTWACSILAETLPAPGQGVEIPDFVRVVAKTALMLRAKSVGRISPPSTDVARAEQLSRAPMLAIKSVEHMKTYFNRHSTERKGKGWNSKTHPSAERVAWDLNGGDEGRAWVVRVLAGRYRANPEVLDEQYAPPSVAHEVAACAERALSAGAREPLTYIGAGMTGIVFVDANGIGYKVYRGLYDSMRSMAVNEFEWLTVAAQVLGSRVVHPLCFDRDNLVLGREFIQGKPGGWASNLSDHHRAIEREMLPHGWTAPEFKEDSYVFPEGSPKTPVLVDASMAHRVGDVLLAYVDEIITGVRPWLDERPPDLGFVLRVEASNGTITRDDANVRLLTLEQELA